jgi:hypothetical protein
MTHAHTPVRTISEQADELEHEMMKTLDGVPSNSALYTMGETDPRVGVVRPPLQPGQHMLMGEDPRLPKMPQKPTALDFYHLRFRQGGIQHLLQSANQDHRLRVVRHQVRLVERNRIRHLAGEGEDCSGIRTCL